MAMEMDLHDVHANQFTNYSKSEVMIKGQSYATNILVTNDNVVDFAVSDITTLKVDDLHAIVATKPDLIIFGNKNKIAYPHHEILQLLQQNNIGFEVMPIEALCRTFNFLISEERKIAAILFLSSN